MIPLNATKKEKIIKNTNLKFLKYVKFLFKKKNATIRDTTNNNKYKNIFEEIKFEEIKFFIFLNF